MTLRKVFIFCLLLRLCKSDELEDEESTLTRIFRDVTGQYHPEHHGLGHTHSHEAKHDDRTSLSVGTYSYGYDFPPPPRPPPDNSGTPNGYANCGCVPKGRCSPEVLAVMPTLLRTLKNDVRCGVTYYELCCPDDPWPGPIDYFKPQAECVPEEFCVRKYGGRPTDVQDYGVIGPCIGLGSVRCLDNKPLPPPPGPISIVVPIVPIYQPPPTVYEPPPTVYEPPTIPPTTPPTVPPTTPTPTVVYEPPPPPVVYEPPTTPVVTYEPPPTPVVTYEPPTTPVVTYEPPPTPVVTYEPPTTPVVTYEPPTTPVVTYEPPSTPVVTYEPPSTPVVSYEPPTPVSTYEVPTATYEPPTTYEAPIPSTTYGAPDLDDDIFPSYPRPSYNQRRYFGGYSGLPGYGYPSRYRGYFRSGPGFGFRKRIYKGVIG